jgi:hypothetical protein
MNLRYYKITYANLWHNVKFSQEEINIFCLCKILAQAIISFVAKQSLRV